MGNKAKRCVDEYYVGDWGATWHCDRLKGHTGWHSEKIEEKELVYSRDKLKGQRKIEVEFRWRRGEMEKYDPKTDTFK